MFIRDYFVDTTGQSCPTGGVDAAAQTTAGLQKWVFNQSTSSWQLGYTLQNGLALGRLMFTPESYVATG
jgi:hypothetical protein